MKYPDGQEVRLGDIVELWDGNEGAVVCSIDTSEYSDAYPRKQWEYLGSGALIMSDKAGLLHYKEPDGDMRLLARSADGNKNRG